MGSGLMRGMGCNIGSDPLRSTVLLRMQAIAQIRLSLSGRLAIPRRESRYHIMRRNSEVKQCRMKKIQNSRRKMGGVALVFMTGMRDGLAGSWISNINFVFARS